MLLAGICPPWRVGEVWVEGLWLQEVPEAAVWLLFRWEWRSNDSDPLPSATILTQNRAVAKHRNYLRLAHCTISSYKILCSLPVAPSGRDAGLFESVFLSLQPSNVQLELRYFGGGFGQLRLRCRQSRLGSLLKTPKWIRDEIMNGCKGEVDSWQGSQWGKQISRLSENCLSHCEIFSQMRSRVSIRRCGCPSVRPSQTSWNREKVPFFDQNWDI